MPADNKPLDVKAWTIHDLWAKYEDITMHFNDLLSSAIYLACVSPFVIWTWRRMRR
jgi:hypothetical protein